MYKRNLRKPALCLPDTNEWDKMRRDSELNRENGMRKEKICVWYLSSA